MSTLTSFPSSQLFSRRLLIVAGKGGVGRTTAACCLAFAAAAQGKRVLLAQTSALQPLEKVLGYPSSLSTIKPIRKGLWGVSITPQAAIQEYGSMVLRSSFLSKQIFERDAVQTLLQAIPGLFDYSMLGKVWYHTTEKLGQHHRYDLVILDAPATGHLVPMLQVPANILRVTSIGPLAEPAKACQSLLTDPQRCLAVLVTLAEELPTVESVELHRQLQHLGISTGAIIFNRLYPNRFSKEQAAVIQHMAVPALPKSILPIAQAALLQHQKSISDQTYIESIRNKIDAPHILLPYLFESSFQIESIERLAKMLSYSGSLNK